MSATRLRLRQAPRAIARAATHPSWLIENFRLARRRKALARREFSLQPYGELCVSESEAAAAVFGLSAADYESLCAERWRPPAEPSDGQLLYGAREELGNLLAAAIATLHPRVVVEAGVAQGVSTALILDGLERQGGGELHSIDLPVLDADADFVGRLVPERLRERWTLHLGPSRRLVPELMERLAPVDLFLHDADHTYESQLQDYRAAWPHLREGGLLLSDDVINPAFPEFAESVGGRAMLVDRGTGADAIGILRKGST